MTTLTRIKFKLILELYVISSIFDEESEELTSIAHPYSRKIVPCNCPKYNRNLVDACTKIIHKTERDSDDDQDLIVIREYNNPLLSLEDNSLLLLEDNFISEDSNDNQIIT
ncbi:hypothetical protein RCL_jg6818.t1 [Rhizophagus clarus]|uniref:Uncharacterized protein n=1 Tax=Rhizophagus clarus TaxID=94130 RepID=A0A8H3LE67_9GLOM|nr:hypothetical protein RCL_jg6818.t1 [Rhizophagus clarus]